MDDARRAVAIVTGAAGGMGRAIRARLAATGHRLVLTDRAVPDDADPGDVWIAADVRDADLPGRLVEAAEALDGGRWTVVVAAGMSREQDYLSVDREFWDTAVAVNLRSAYELAVAASASMMRHDVPGSIVFISSIAYATGGSNPAYGAAKAGVNAITFGLSQQLGPHGIRVNAIAPGVIATPMVSATRTPEEWETFVDAVSSQIPLRRLGEPEDVAGMVAFLAGPDSSYVTGSVLHLTGGMDVLPSFGPMLERALSLRG